MFLRDQEGEVLELRINEEEGYDTRKEIHISGVSPTCFGRFIELWQSLIMCLFSFLHRLVRISDLDQS